MIRIVILLIAIACSISNLQGQSSWKFDFGAGATKPGYKQVLPTDTFTMVKGFGFSSGDLVSQKSKGKDELQNDFITSSKPFYFSVAVPEGDYNVKVYIGDRKGVSNTTVRAECRRLMIAPFTTKSGQVVVKDFTVHVRTPLISGTQDSVKLKPRERDYLHWDQVLTLEFNGASPKICGVEIERTETAKRIFLAGNSTVVDQAGEPFAAWGQMIPVFFQPGKVTVANYAESGETLKAFRGERRLAKILSLMREGDYLFIEFAHNDQKPGGNHLDPFTTYKETLKYYINEARSKKAIPVLVTSMHRRKFDDNGKIVNTLEDYPEAVRQTGAEENVPVIDLNAMSKTLYEAWGPDRSLKAFVHYPANTFPDQTTELKDNTHFSPYGGYQLAKCVVQGLKSNVPDLAKLLLKDVPSFDPARPDPIESFVWPLSIRQSAVKPDGN